MGIKRFFNDLLRSDVNNEVTRPSSLGRAPKEREYNLGNKDLKDESTKETDVNKETHEMGEGKETQQGTDTKVGSQTYNLIILDESGSMGCVRGQTISGCNETLNSIRNMAKEHDEIKQYVSIFCFDTSNSRYLFKNVPIEDTYDLTYDDYRPNACTPLYDAIGYTVSQLKQLLSDMASVGMVTIITDGYENASQKWSHGAVVELIESLKKKGWVFTFIGANIDVERTARDLNIDSFMEFDQTDEGTRVMFERERRSRYAYNEKRSYMSKKGMFDLISQESRAGMLGACNDNYFVEGERIAPDIISLLKEDDIFVFGSNVDGLHSGGASYFAVECFGAEMGKAEGMQGQSYAIPTVGNSFEELKEAIERFNQYVVTHPKNKFMLTAIGCGNAGYGVEQIAPLFRQAYAFGNVYVPKQFLQYVTDAYSVN